MFFNSRIAGVHYGNLLDCIVDFGIKKEQKFIFNICENQMMKDFPRQKIKIDTSYALLIEVFFDNNVTVEKRVLNEIQKQEFISIWKNNIGCKKGLPNKNYLIKVQKGDKRIRIFYTDGEYISEGENNAKYKIDNGLYFSTLFDN